MYKELMIQEISKFIDVYNSLSDTKIDISYITKEYDFFIRVLGNYIYKTFRPENWTTSVLECNSVCIDFSVFENSIHKERVKQFLLCLQNAFYDDSLDTEVADFLEHTSEFSEDEKKICKEFYHIISILNKAIKKEAFLNTEIDMSSRNMINGYQSELKAYNEFLVKNVDHRNIIEKFDRFFKQIASSKKHTHIKF